MNILKEDQNSQTKAIFMLFVLLVVGSIVGIIVSFTSLAVLQSRVGNVPEVKIVWEAFRTNFTIDTIVICMNLSLLLGLFLECKRDFTKTQCPVLLGLL